MLSESPRTFQTTIVKARVPADEAARLQEIAEENDRTLSAELRRALRLYLSAYEAEAA